MKFDDDREYVSLDTETTGFEPKNGHRIIEIGAVKIVNRKVTKEKFHGYINPNREVPEDATRVHGITNEFLKDKGYFADVAEEFIEFIRGTVLVIHNAPFDIGFLNAELATLGDKRFPSLDGICDVFDTLAFAKNKHPGQRNTLDALCRRYHVDNSNRQYHGALLDAELLADVYINMTGGQEVLNFGVESQSAQTTRIKPIKTPIHVLRFDDKAHNERLQAIDKASGGQCVWLKAG